MRNNYKNQILEIKIEETTKKGYGKGFFVTSSGQQKVVEVPFTTPGDVVQAQVVRKKRDTLLGRLVEIISPSKDRILPTCVHFATCGGCVFQHISYEKELAQKEAFVHKCFAALPKEEAVFYPIVPSPAPWRYRNKMEYSFSQNRQKDKFLGLIKNLGKGHVFNVTECYLPNEWFVEALEAVRTWWNEHEEIQAYHPLRNCGALRTLTMREGFRTGDRLVMLTVSGNPEDALTKKHLDSFVSNLRAAIESPDNIGRVSIFLRIQQVAKGMATNFFEMLLYGPEAIREVLYIQPSLDSPPAPINFQISPTAFFQPNTLQAEQLYSRVLQMANVTKDCVIYDLYCGTGTMGICLAPYAKQVVGVDVSPEATLDARANVVLNKADNVVVITSAVRYILQAENQGTPLPLPDVVIIDPPRPGLDEQALQALIELRSKKIVYVSCNPLTQVDNLRSLIAAGYVLKSVQPMDQFPQTVHVENIAFLQWEGEPRIVGNHAL